MEATDIKEIKLPELEKAVKEAWDEGKVAFLFDQTGNASVFFRYKAKLIECARSVVQVAMGAAQPDDVVEEWRRSYVYAMKSGDTCVFHMDKVAPDFLNKYKGTMFPVPAIFDKAEITKKPVYKSMLKSAEDVDNFGNRGWFEMDEKFQVALLSSLTPEELDDYKDRVPLEKCSLIKIVE